MCGVYLFISITADNTLILTSLSSSTDPSSPTNQVIPSIEELILALPTRIDDPVTFGIRLGVTYDRCGQLIKNYSSDINAQVRVIAAEWYDRTPVPSWNKVVEALFKHGLVDDAMRMARMKSLITTTILDGDSGHH